MIKKIIFIIVLFTLNCYCQNLYVYEVSTKNVTTTNLNKIKSFGQYHSIKQAGGQGGFLTDFWAVKSTYTVFYLKLCPAPTEQALIAAFPAAFKLNYIISLYDITDSRTGAKIKVSSVTYTP